MRAFLLAIVLALNSVGLAAQQPSQDSLAKAVIKIDSARTRTSSTFIKRWLAEARALVARHFPG